MIFKSVFLSIKVHIFFNKKDSIHIILAKKVCEKKYWLIKFISIIYFLIKLYILLLIKSFLRDLALNIKLGREVREGGKRDSYISQIHVNHTKCMYMYEFESIRMYLGYQIHSREAEEMMEICYVSQYMWIHFNILYLQQIKPKFDHMNLR